MNGLEATYHNSNNVTSLEASLVTELRRLIQNYLHFMAIISFALLIIVYLYFPDK